MQNNKSLNQEFITLFFLQMLLLYNYLSRDKANSDTVLELQQQLKIAKQAQNELQKRHQEALTKVHDLENEKTQAVTRIHNLEKEKEQLVSLVFRSTDA